MPKKVLVTGALGFIAQHIVKQLVAGSYAVVGTVRLAAKGQKLAANTKGAPGSFEYVIVPDIAAAGAFDSVFVEHPDIAVVLHTASPFFYDTTEYEKDLILPAIHGTKNIMDTIWKLVQAGKSQVERVVVTSSDAAIYSADDEQNAALAFDETSWNNILYADLLTSAVNAYYGAKAFAEKAAWSYTDKPGFPALTCVNPVYVFGPQAYANEMGPRLNTLNEVVNLLLRLGPTDTFDNDKGGFVDVRDVARAHLAAFEKASTVGKRLYMTNGKFSTQMMLDEINSRFPRLRGTIPKGTPGLGPEDIATLAQTSNAATRELLGFQFTSLGECVGAVVQQILDYQGQTPALLSKV